MGAVNINIVPGGLNRNSTDTDRWAGVCIEVDALPTEGGGWNAGQVRQINQTSDLEQYGITATAANNYHKLIYWHVSEVFRLSPDSIVFLQLVLPAATLNDIFTAFHNANENVRMFALVREGVKLEDDSGTAIQTELETLANGVQPARCIVNYKFDTSIPVVTASNANRVMIGVGEDTTTDGLAATIKTGIGLAGDAGTLLGATLARRVHQKPSWTQFPVSGGGRWQSLGLIDGTSAEDLTQAAIDAHAGNGLNFVRRVPRLAGAYVANARMAVATSDDYAIITNGRVIDKAVVTAYDAVVTSIDRPVYVTPSTGKISAEDIGRFEGIIRQAIETNMLLGKVPPNQEISTDETGQLPTTTVVVDPDSPVLQNETVNITINIVPVGASNTINVNIGLNVQTA